jgi:site-specific recombinase XerD
VELGGRAQEDQAARRRAGIRRRVAPHQLRHACAVQMREDGFDIVYISRHLGHQDLAITTHYMRGINDDEIIRSAALPP